MAVTRSIPIPRSPARRLSAERKLASGLLMGAWFGSGAPMTIEEDIEALRARIDKVQSDCDAWRVTGPEKKYLEAYFLVEALTTQLDKCLKHLAAEQPAR